MKSRAVFTAAVFALILVAGCGSNNSLAPFQPEVANNPDTFQFQATGITNVTTTVNYIWTNTGTTANIDQSSAISGGTATLTVRDAVGTQVYTGDLATGGSFTSSAGTTGDWTITVALTGLSGTLNFRAQKP